MKLATLWDWTWSHMIAKKRFITAQFIIRQKFQFIYNWNLPTFTLISYKEEELVVRFYNFIAILLNKFKHPLCFWEFFLCVYVCMRLEVTTMSGVCSADITNTSCPIIWPFRCVLMEMYSSFEINYNFNRYLSAWIIIYVAVLHNSFSQEFAHCT